MVREYLANRRVGGGVLRRQGVCAGGLLFLRQILRVVAKAAGVIAVVAVQSDSTASAAPTDEYSTTFAEMRGNPLDAEALNVAVTACDLDMAGEEAQASNIGIF